MTGDPDGAIVEWLDREHRPGPLSDLRVGIKDNIAVAGVVRRAGLPPAEADVAQETDAEVVRSLAAAGAQIVATTTTHQLGYGVVTPGTRNPRAPDRIAGGSSGGAAAAVARGLLDGGVGSDSAGSVRIPAACCGVVGFKPSEGMVSRHGLLPFAATLDTVGPVGRDVATVTRMLPAMLLQPGSPARTGPLRIGLLAQVTQAPLDPEVDTAWRHIVDGFRSAGAKVSTVDLPLFAEAHPASGRILAAEALRTQRWALEQRGGDLDPQVRGLLEAAESLPQDKVLEARRTAALFRDRLGGVFSDVDILVLPTLPCRVPPVGATRLSVGSADESLASALTRLAGPWNLAGVPAGTVPVGRDGGGGPIGVQVVGSWHADHTVVFAMGLVEQLAGGPWPPVQA